MVASFRFQGVIEILRGCLKHPIHYVLLRQAFFIQLSFCNGYSRVQNWLGGCNTKLSLKKYTHKYGQNSGAWNLIGEKDAHMLPVSPGYNNAF